MKFKPTFLLPLLASLFFLSCTKNDPVFEDENCIGDNYPILINRKIKEIESKTATSVKSRKAQFTFNNFNLLTRQHFFTYAYDDNFLYTYTCNNSLSKLNGNRYEYNSSGLLASVQEIDGFVSYKLTYEGQKVLVLGKYINFEIDIEMELNKENLVKKIIRADSYSLFDYDARGNLIKAIDFDLNNNVLYEYELQYDQNPNPFYGQLQSVYLAKFISFFYYRSYIGAGNLKSCVDNFNFPYFKNNLLQIKEKIGVDEYKTILENEFTYNLQNYPSSFTSSYFGFTWIYKVSYY